MLWHCRRKVSSHSLCRYKISCNSHKELNLFYSFYEKPHCRPVGQPSSLDGFTTTVDGSDQRLFYGSRCMYYGHSDCRRVGCSLGKRSSRWVDVRVTGWVEGWSGSFVWACSGAQMMIFQWYVQNGWALGASISRLTLTFLFFLNVLRCSIGSLLLILIVG